MADVLVLVVVAGLGAVVVVVVVAGLDVVGADFDVVVAGLEAAGAFGAVDGVWATATEAIANRVLSDKVVGLIVRRLC
jgi:hypothetical protein